jgi:hypothetical protein
MEWPCVTPTIKGRCDLDVVECCRHVADDPEDKEETHPVSCVRGGSSEGDKGKLPRLPNNHSHVFASQTERNHAKEIQHPVYGKRAVTVGNRIAKFLDRDLGLTCNGIVVKEVDLKRHGYEAIRQR